MALITYKLPFDDMYIDLIKQVIKVLVIFILYYSLEKSNKINVFKLILYVILGLMFNKLVIEEIIDIN
jgi:hypothetical protein